MNIAIILAGGVGSRVGANMPKQFINVYGKPVIAYTLDIFEHANFIDAIGVVCVKTHQDLLKKIIKKYKFKKINWIIDGGSTFQESMIHGVDFLQDKIKDDDIVSFHFSASPFVTEPIIRDSIRVAKEKGNGIATTDFILLSGLKDSEDRSTTYVNRDSLACMSSPHSFRYSKIKQIYDEARNKQLLDKVEPHTTTLMYLMKEPIYFSKGSHTNIKITTKEDLRLFKGWVLTQKTKK